MSSVFTLIEKMIRAEQAQQNGGFISQVDLDGYLQKLKENAEFVTHFSSVDLSAFVAFYCNDPEGENAFITLVLTNPEFRGYGLASSLLKAVLDIVKRRGVSFCGLEVKKNNAAAISVYKKAGFVISEDREDSFLMKVRLK